MIHVGVHTRTRRSVRFERQRDRLILLDIRPTVAQGNERQVDGDASLATSGTGDKDGVQGNVGVGPHRRDRRDIGEVCGDVAAHLERASRHLECAEGADCLVRAQVVIDVDRQLLSEGEQIRRCLVRAVVGCQLDPAEVGAGVEGIRLYDGVPVARLDTRRAGSRLAVQADEGQVSGQLIGRRDIEGSGVANRTDDILGLDLCRRSIVRRTKGPLEVVRAPVLQRRVRFVLQDSPEVEPDRQAGAGLGDHGQLGLVDRQGVGRDGLDPLPAVVGCVDKVFRGTVAADEDPLARQQAEGCEVQRG